MNLQLADGTVRCPAHMDASSYDRETDRPCLYCQEATSTTPAGLTPNQERTYAYHLNCGRTRSDALRIATDLPMAVRLDTGVVHLGDAVRAGLARNNLRALSVAISRSFCEFCGEAPRPVGDDLCESCGL